MIEKEDLAVFDLLKSSVNVRIINVHIMICRVFTELRLETPKSWGEGKLTHAGCPVQLNQDRERHCPWNTLPYTTMKNTCNRSYTLKHLVGFLQSTKIYLKPT